MTAPPPHRSQRSRLIGNALAERFPTGEYAYGDLGTVARDFGVTSEYVRQVAKKLGMRRVPKHGPREGLPPLRYQDGRDETRRL